ncbi:alpha/beta hydrolase [Pseudozobellia sp. WGM2]|uniref:alpha/beta hydrolase n=1 Tax=Pseudozobellia sp. WGM2 TaxID=2787625 RepID=UPI001FD79062|nr:alpha/beta hydrolase [Pseudozobellia sp. WGM2]
MQHFLIIPRKTISLLSVVTVYFFTYFGHAQTELLYKKIDTTRLFLEVHTPEKPDASRKYPAFIFFFGGGWQKGDRSHFKYHAEYFKQRDMVCILADYRTESKHGTSPFIAVQDAKSAIRYVRKNADKLGVDPNQIIVSGGSAGGHLAASTALLEKYNDPNDDLQIDCKPNALVLYNPVIDNGPGGYGYERIGDAYKDFSPLHNIEKGAPPTLLFLGTKDHHIPVVTAEYYKMVMDKVGSRCVLKIYEDKGHGFFNHPFKKMYKKTIQETDEFLQSLGYIDEQPLIQVN